MLLHAFWIIWMAGEKDEFFEEIQSDYANKCFYCPGFQILACAEFNCHSNRRTAT